MLSITIRLIEYSAVMVMMPARMGCIFILVCSSAVTNPAAAPASEASSSPKTGCSASVATTATAAPSVKLPSTVRSGMFKIR